MKSLQKDLYQIKSGIDSSNLVHTFRLENSLRTANTQSTNNNNIIKFVSCLNLYVPFLIPQKRNERNNKQQANNNLAHLFKQSKIKLLRYKKVSGNNKNINNFFCFSIFNPLFDIY